ncbi:hypothetical protein [Rhodococcus jostii]|uniref:hypothetical protein n=1 Tax=Rhodococcus jostii TaxID=132919 RepID=UPI000933E9DF|nr:hypothetical protein [Rhodococcus jostii]
MIKMLPVRSGLSAGLRGAGAADFAAAIEQLADMQPVADVSGHSLETVLEAWREFESRAFDPNPPVYHEPTWLSAELVGRRQKLPAHDAVVVIEAHINIALLRDRLGTYTRGPCRVDRGPCDP